MTNPATTFINILLNRGYCLPAAVNVTALILTGLAAEPRLVELADANDADHFIEGLRSPAFDHMLVGVLAEIREVVAA